MGSHFISILADVRIHIHLPIRTLGYVYVYIGIYACLIDEGAQCVLRNVVMYLILASSTVSYAIVSYPIIFALRL